MPQDINPHLYNPHRLDSTKNSIGLWKNSPTGRPTNSDETGGRDSTPVVEQQPDYSFQRDRFSQYLDNYLASFNNRYSQSRLNDRTSIQQKPRIYIRSKVFSNIKNKRKFSDDLKLNIVKYDNITGEYIFSQDLDNVPVFERRIREFIAGSEGWKKTVTLLDNFRLINDIDRKFDRQIYIHNEKNVNLYLKLFSDANPNQFENVLLSLGVTRENFEKISKKSYRIKPGALDTGHLNLMFQCCDVIEKIEGSPRYEVGPEGEVIVTQRIYNPELSVPQGDLETVCVIDSGIQPIEMLRPIINNTAGHNYGLNGLEPLEDYFGHGTGVGAIVAFGKQILREKPVLNPVCRICSISIPLELLSIEELVSKIRDLHNRFGVKIFNLSFGEEGHLGDDLCPLELTKRLDLLMHELDIICVISAGNIKLEDPDNHRIHLYDNYPLYWKLEESNITSLAGSINGLTVGSIWHKDSLPDEHASTCIASYSRKNNISVSSNVRKPDLTVFGGDTKQNKPFYTYGRDGSIVRKSGTSVSAPYVSHLLTLLRKAYPRLRMTTIKALMLNSLEQPNESVLEHYVSNQVSPERLYGNGYFSPDGTDGSEEISLVYSDNNTATVIIEDEIDFSNYQPRRGHPFKTINLKLPELNGSPGKKVAVNVTLAYNSFIDRDCEDLSGYNGCYMSFSLHDGSVEFQPVENQPNVTYFKRDDIKPIKGNLWEDKSNLGVIWNNSQVKSFKINRKTYAKFVDGGIQITIRARLNDSDSVMDHYRRLGHQKFSIALRIFDAGEDGVMYESMKNLNELKLANELTVTGNVQL